MNRKSEYRTVYMTIALIALVLISSSCMIVIGQHTVEWVRQAPSENGQDPNAFVYTWATECSNGTSYQVGWMTGTAEFGDSIIVVANDTVEQCFVVKFAPNGTEEWVVLVNSTGPSRCYALTVVEDGILVGGRFSGDVLAWNADGSDVTGIWEEEPGIGFIAKIFTDGSRGDFTVIGNLDNTTTYSIVVGLGVDADGNVYMSGNFNGSLTLGTEELTTDQEDIFLAAFAGDANNGEFLYANSTGGRTRERVTDSATNAEGFTCVIGIYHGRNEFGSDEEPEEEFDSIFMMGVEPNGTRRYLTVVTGNVGAYLSAVDIDEIGHCSFVGSFNKSLDQFTSEGVSTGFFGRVNSAGRIVMFNVTNGDVEDYLNDISCDDSNGDCYIVGSYATNITFGDQTFEGNEDMIIIRINRDGHLVESLQSSGGASEGLCVCTAEHDAYAGGIFAETLELDTFSLTSPSNTTFFAFKWDTESSDVEES